MEKLSNTHNPPVMWHNLFGYVRLSYNPYFSIYFFCRNSVFLSQQIRRNSVSAFLAKRTGPDICGKPRLVSPFSKLINGEFATKLELINSRWRRWGWNPSWHTWAVRLKGTKHKNQKLPHVKKCRGYTSCIMHVTTLTVIIFTKLVRTSMIIRKTKLSPFADRRIAKLYIWNSTSTSRCKNSLRPRLGRLPPEPAYLTTTL